MELRVLRRIMLNYFLRFKVKYVVLCIIIVLLLDFFGAFTHFFELDFNTEFHYPFDGDVIRYARQMRLNQDPDVKPINIYNYTFISSAKEKCSEERTQIEPMLVFLVKSSLEHFVRRDAIRKSWGYDRRFSDVTIRTVFLLGTNSNSELQKHINIESDQYRDIVQSDFGDTYYNNTIKTMMGFRWSVEYCPRAKYYMFVDDDFYVSAKNVLRFIKNPRNYPKYLEEADETLKKLAEKLNKLDLHNKSINKMLLNEAYKVLENGVHSIETKDYFRQIEDFVVKGSGVLQEKKEHTKRNMLSVNPKDDQLFAGFVFKSSPHRHKLSKWHVTLNEYPYHMWPTYVTAGAFLLSRETLFEMYYVSMFTKHFRFDDIYLGIVALKAGIEPLHSQEFYFNKPIYLGPKSYRYKIACHGYEKSNEMLQVWNEVRAAGNA